MTAKARQAAFAMAASLSLSTVSTTPLRAAPPPEIMQTTKWVIHWDDDRCNLFRAGQDSPLHLKIYHAPASGFVSVHMGNRGWKKEPSKGAKELDVVLLPSGEKVTGSSQSGPAEQGALLAVNNLGEAFLDRLAESRGIAVESKGTRLIEMTFPPARTVVTQLRTCTTDLLRDWGIDGAALAALRQRAVPIPNPPNAIFSSDDYPRDALTLERQGPVVARLDVTKEGKVGACHALNEEARAVLAIRTCQILRDRLKYRPAIGSDGKPAATQTVIYVHWQLPK